MNLESLELRIEELQHTLNQKKLLKKALEEDIVKLRGKIEEVFLMIESWQEKNEYGYHTTDGNVRVLKLPTIGSKKGVEEALEGKVQAPTGENEEEIHAERAIRASNDAQQAVDTIARIPKDG